jgi:hypothetical protein
VQHNPSAALNEAVRHYGSAISQQKIAQEEALSAAPLELEQKATKETKTNLS